MRSISRNTFDCAIERINWRTETIRPIRRCIRRHSLFAIRTRFRSTWKLERSYAASAHMMDTDRYANITAKWNHLFRLMRRDVPLMPLSMLLDVSEGYLGRICTSECTACEIHVSENRSLRRMPIDYDYRETRSRSNRVNNTVISTLRRSLDFALSTLVCASNSHGVNKQICKRAKRAGPDWRELRDTIEITNSFTCRL